jgi:hypothetical protein
MVNGRFLPVVSNWWMRRAPFASVLARIAGDRNLTRRRCSDFFANPRQIKLNAITCDLSSAAKARADCEPKSQQDVKWTARRTTGIATMFFLLRMAFWLGLVLVLLPREKTPESGKLPQVSVSDAVTAATAAVSDMSQFCKRQPQACEVGGQAATVIGARAQEGARKIYQSITDKKSDADKKSPDHTGSIGGVDEPDPAQAEAASPDTLTPDDLAVEWRGLP